MEKKLGKGLSALIPTHEQDKSKEKVVYVNVADIARSPYQPREQFHEEKLGELIASIREKGVIQPILVRSVSEGKYELIAGERRLRAVMNLNMERIPALIKDVDDLDALELSLIENIQREELNPIEEAHAFKRLGDEFGFTQEQIGQAIGKDRSTIANTLRLLLLPRQIQEALAAGAISMGHARALLALESERTQLRCCEKIMRRKLSVRQAEQLVKQVGAAPRRPAERDHHIVTIEEDLQHVFGTRVKIHQGKKRGKIEIQYYSHEDLERIVTLLQR
jgi:ParB family chromosome partitioning protein